MLEKIQSMIIQMRERIEKSTDYNEIKHLMEALARLESAAWALQSYVNLMNEIEPVEILDLVYDDSDDDEHKKEDSKS